MQITHTHISFQDKAIPQMFSQPIVSEPIEVEVFNTTTSIIINLTEGGSIDIELPQPVEVDPGNNIEEFRDMNKISTHTFKGADKSNNEVKIKDTLIQPRVEIGGETKFFVKDIVPRDVIFNSSNSTVFVDENVTVKFDMMCFLPSEPQIDHVENEPLLNSDNWTIYGSSLDDRDERVNLVKEYKRHLRTATIEIQQQVNGPPERQIRKALDKLEPIRDLISFVQGVEPTPIRAQITKTDGQRYNERYEQWFSYYSTSIGHAFFGPNLSWGNLRGYIEDSYQDYIDKRDRYRLHMVISWYLDSINTTRTVESQLASICSGIELFAKRYSDLGPDYIKTGNRIAHIVNTLDVETRDLAEFSGTYEMSESESRGGNTPQERINRLIGHRYLQYLMSILPFDSDEEEEIRYTHEYFYSRSRQYVIHGDNLKTTSDELYRDCEAAHILFQRLLRNQLIDKNNFDEYPRLKDLSAEDTRI